MPKLTAKQEKFIQEYLIDLNATQAAIRAGYSAKTAEVIAFENLRKPYLQAAIQEAMQERAKRTQVTQDMIVNELAKIAFSDLKSVVSWTKDGKIIVKPSDEVDGTIMSEISETEINYGDYIKRTKKVKLHDKLRALELLGRHQGMFKDNLNINAEVGVQIVDDIK
jgi:Phage terminase, small subunit